MQEYRKKVIAVVNILYCCYYDYFLFKNLPKLII